MRLEFVPLLQVQRELYRLPRGWERFRAYLSTMIDPETHDIRLPIVAMNPMGKDHVPALLDQYLELDADGLAARAVAHAASRLASVPGEFKLALVIADDAGGGWTNRYTAEFAHRFESRSYFKRGWLTGLLWTSERPAVQTVREEVLTAVYRAAHSRQHGFVRTLREMILQEGYAMAMAGCVQPALDADELAYTGEVIAPHLDARDRATTIAALFGDQAAHSLGYRPLGLSPRAGFALALHNARAALTGELAGAL
jgi:hypothetical protein